MNKNRIRGTRKFTIILFCFMVLFFLCIFIVSSYSVPELVSSITVDSMELNYQNQTPGSFRVTKSAKWISSDKVRVTLDLKTISLEEASDKNIIIVLDTSNTMKNEKVLGIKRELQNIINMVDSNKQMAIITYNNSSKIISNFTSNQEKLKEKIENLTVETEGRNLYQAFLNVEQILKEDQNHLIDTNIILIMGGYPSKEIPNEIGQFDYLKNQYPNIAVSVIPYEMEGDIEKISQIGDQVFLSNSENIESHLQQALDCTKGYQKFQITDFLNTNFFDAESIQNMKVTNGNVERERNRLNWNLDGLPSGGSSQLEYVITRKIESTEEIYLISEREEIRYQIKDIDEKVTSTLTPVLGRYFDIMYDKNEPSECTVKNVPEKSTYLVYETVEVPSDIPTCKGYQFEGWKNVTEELDLPNDGSLQMPESDVTLRAVWSKLSIKKNMDGTIYTYRDSTIRKVNHVDTEELWEYKDTIKKIIFQDTFKELSNAVEVFDISKEKNNGVLVYIVSENGGYTAYIQGDGKVIANPDSSYLFDQFKNLETIEGIEYFDTSKVTNMSHMFGRCRSLTSIDLSHFDTSNVTDMSYMFHDCINLTKVDLNGLDISKVQTMQGMFENCMKLKEVNFKDDNLTNVLDMRDMFKYSPNLEVITPEILNIGEDTNTDGIFEGGNLLKEPPVKKEYTVIINHNTYGKIQPTTLTISFWKTNTVLVNPKLGYYLEDFSCTNGYKNNALIHSSSSEEQTITISNNHENVGSICNATFSLAIYKIEYNLDGGIIEGEYPTTYTMESLVTLKNPTKTGYDFLGWTTEGETTPKMTVTIPKGSIGNKSYTANWTPKQYTVTINKNTGGTTSVSNLSVPYGGSNTFTVTPNPGYYLSSISCTNGYTTNVKVGITETSSQEITISNNKKLSESTCSVSFKELLLTEYLIHLSEIDTNNLIYDDTIDNNLRYIGLNPNNYVRFNNELWRIIGVMNNIEDASGDKKSRVKLIRDEPIGEYSWDNKLSGVGSSTSANGSNDWSDATLMEILNHGHYWNQSSGTCSSGKNGAVTSCNFSSIGLTMDAKGMISNIKWNIGGHNTYEDTVLNFYTKERGINVYSGRPATWKGYVGLMYPSDYGYAVGKNVRSICLSQNIHNYNENNCKENDWLYLATTEWTLTPRSNHAYYAFNINGNGYLYYSSAYNTYAIRPSVFLNTNMKKTGGRGTEQDPFTIE